MTTRVWHRHSFREPSGRAHGRPLERTFRAAMSGTRSARARDDVVRSTRNGNEVRESQKGCGSHRSSDRGAQHHASGSKPWEAERPWREPGALKPERGAAGKPAATHAGNALERENPRGAASGRTTNPRSIVTDSGGEQGPEAGFAKRPHVASATSPSAGNGKRAAGAERRYGSARREKLRRGEPHERHRPERVGRTRETKRGKRVRNPAAAPEPGRGKSRVSGLPHLHALKGQELLGGAVPERARQAGPVIL